MALSWWTYLSTKPATIGISVSQRSYSNELIRQNREFGLCIVGPDLADAAFKCGTVSGRDVDKASAYQIELVEAESIGTKLVKQFRIAMECSAINFVEAQDHTFFVAEVVNIHTNPDVPQLFAFDGYRRLDTL